jgi:hypothetical protein
MAKHIQFDEYGTRQHANCVACEELFADALDQVLSDADQIFFDHHLGSCVPCSESFAQAQRGAAWLSLLKTTIPAPSANLLARILAETGAARGDREQVRFGQAHGLFESAAGVSQTLPGNVLPFVPKVAHGSFSRFTRLAMEPRLAMTAAMAFFSIALTLNLLGVRLDQMNTADFTPTNLKQTYFQANATAVRYYDNLRVVRVLESRVDDIRQSNADDVLPTRPQAEPQAEPRPEPQPKPQEKPHGSSRRESPLPTRPRVLNAQLDFSTEPLRHVALDFTPDLTQEGGLA